MIVGVEDGRGWVSFGQVLGISLTMNVVFGVTVGIDAGSLVDKRSIPGVSTSVGDIPEGTAEVDRSVFVRD